MAAHFLHGCTLRCPNKVQKKETPVRDGGTKAGKGMTMEQTSEARLREAHQRLMDTLDGLRNGTLTKLEADEIQAAIEEALRVQRFSANH
jgi:hypothetical protein